MTRLRPDTQETFDVDDPWRRALRRPVFGSLLLAFVFLVYTAPIKETPALFNHAPWLNDPFDTVISFMMLFVPLVALLCGPRVLLCRRFEPLLASRIRDVLRGCRVVLAGVSVTLLVEWISVVIGDNRAAWDRATWLQIGLLALMSAIDLAAVLAIRRIALPSSESSGPDWLSDTILVVKTKSESLGPLRRPIEQFSGYVEQHLLKGIRRHPVWTSLAACGVLGAGVGLNQAVRESYRVSVAEVAVVLLAMGMFGLLTASGAYLGLVRSAAPCHGARRRLLDASVITSVGVLVPFALRYHLWWLVGATNASADLAQLVALLAISAMAIFGVAYVTESLLGLYPDPGT